MAENVRTAVSNAPTEKAGYLTPIAARNPKCGENTSLYELEITQTFQILGKFPKALQPNILIYKN
jgi:hypothetical protein